MYKLLTSILITVPCILMASPCFTQTLENEWAVHLGGQSSDWATAIAVDSDGNCYTTGLFNGIADFDPSATDFSMTGTGTSSDVFISKLNAAGEFQWAKQLGGSGMDRGYSIATDNVGNVYVTGYFHETVDFDPGDGVFELTSVGNEDIFIAKLDTDGNFIWAKAMGGLSDDQGISIAVDANQNVYTTGFFHHIVDFDPNSGVEEFTSAGQEDIFLQKLDVNGDLVWAGQIGEDSEDKGSGVSLGSNGDVYITGEYRDTPDFDFGSGTADMNSNGVNDAFVARYDSDGNYIWSKNVGGSSFDEGTALYVDQNQNVLVTGIFMGSGDFDPGADVLTLSPQGQFDLFILKLDPDGNLAWAHGLGGDRVDAGRDIITNAAGDVFVLGDFAINVDFDPGANTFELMANTDASLNNSDIFLLRLNANGDFVQAFNFGDERPDNGLGMEFDSSENLYIAGLFGDAIDFDPSAEVAEVESAGGQDAFVVKFSTGTCSESPGCTDPSAINYTPLAICDNESCIYVGCTNPDDPNFNSQAAYDDGSCESYICDCPGDFTGDGFITSSDLTEFLGVFGLPCN